MVAAKVLAAAASAAIMRWRMMECDPRDVAAVQGNEALQLEIRDARASIAVDVDRAAS